MLKKSILFVLIVSFLAVGISLAEEKKEAAPETLKAEGTKQCIVWTSGDREVALKMAFMYTYNCKKRKWMDTVRLLIWGPSAKLLTEDKDLQDYLKQIKEQGVELYACKACADMYGVAAKLEAMGVTVKYAGKLLADMQINGWHVITF